MDRLDMFQAILGKLDEFGWWYMEIIQTDPVTQCTSKEFQECLLSILVVIAIKERIRLYCKDVVSNIMGYAN